MPVRQQTDWNQLFMLVRADGAPAALLAVRPQAIRALDPEQPIYAMQTLEEARRAVVVPAAHRRRCCCRSLPGSRWCMAAVGIFGVMSYSVSARTQEMGVRLAFGAQRRDVVWLVVGHVLKLAGVGLVIGVALLAGRPAGDRRLLFGVEAADASTIVAVTVVLALVAVLPRGCRRFVPAGSIPSRRFATSKRVQGSRFYAVRPVVVWRERAHT